MTMETKDVNRTTELFDLISDLKLDLSEARKARKARRSKMKSSRVNRLMLAEIKSKSISDVLVQRRMTDERKAKQDIVTMTNEAELMYANTGGEGYSKSLGLEMLDDRGDSLLQRINSSASKHPRLAHVASFSRSRVLPLVDTAEAAVEEEKNSEGIRI